MAVLSLCFDADGGWCKALAASCRPRTWSTITGEKLRRKLFNLW